MASTSSIKRLFKIGSKDDKVKNKRKGKKLINTMKSSSEQKEEVVLSPSTILRRNSNQCVTDQRLIAKEPMGDCQKGIFEDNDAKEASKSFKDKSSAFNSLKDESSAFNSSKNESIAYSSSIDESTAPNFTQSRSNSPTRSYDSKEIKEMRNTRHVNEEQRGQKTDNLVFTRSSLFRPFGRTSLPAFAKKWIVEVQQPKYFSKEKQWKYSVLVEIDEYGASIDASSSPLSSQDNMPSLNSSFTAANNTRSLEDFIWLEQALLVEYHGALLLPLLSLALFDGNDWTTSDSLNREELLLAKWDPAISAAKMLNSLVTEGGKVDPQLLSDWLSDVLNAVSGKGERIINFSQSVDLMSSEGMETFLYRNTDPLPKPYRDSRDTSWLGLELKQSMNRTKNRCSDQQGLWSYLTATKNACLYSVGNLNSNYLQLDNSNNRICFWSGFCQNEFNVPEDTGNVEGFDLNLDENNVFAVSDLIMKRRKIVYEKQSFSFSAIDFDSDIIKAHKEIILSQREATIRSMYRLRILLEEEVIISAAWKRFAISLSNLYSCEKDIEKLNLGERKNQKFVYCSKMLSKSLIDDNLRLLAKQKVDRAVPPLKVLSGMLSAYFADLSAAVSSLYTYSTVRKAGETKLKDRSIQFLSEKGPTGSQIVKKKLVQKYLLEQRSLTNIINKRLMISSLAMLGKSTNIRVSRMAWKYFKMESGQASLLSHAAKILLTKLCFNKDDDAMKKEYEESRKSIEEELQVISGFLHLGNKDFNRSVTNMDVPNGKDSVNTSHSVLGEKALILMRKSPGHWNTEICLSIMRAVGITDVEIKLDESSTNMRSLKKVVKNLRENVKRCTDAVDMLKEMIIGNEAYISNINDETSANSTDVMKIAEVRQKFLSGLFLVFGGAFRKERSHNLHSLSLQGIDTHDSAGWIKIDIEKDSKKNFASETAYGQCGKKTLAYQKNRENEVDSFLIDISRLLQNYERRINEVEACDLMQRVGDQLEKHFCCLRADALNAWEKKTDITTAINVATKKRLPLLVNELKSKLNNMNQDISHTTVKEAKARHLVSKQLKEDLEILASRQFKRTSTDRIIEIMKVWANYEESVAKTEQVYLVELIQEIEQSVTKKIIEEDGGAHLFALPNFITQHDSRVKMK